MSLTRLAAQLSKGLRGHLAEGGVPDPVMEFLEDRKHRIPNKMAKWLAFRLRDHLNSQPIDPTDPAAVRAELESLADDIAYIRDYYNGEQGVDLFQFDTIEQAYDAAGEWHQRVAEEMREQGDPSLYNSPDLHSVNLGDGFKMVMVDVTDLENEGKLMGHCVGSGDYHGAVAEGLSEIWSLRDKNDYPHVTVELGQSVDLEDLYEKIRDEGDYFPQSDFEDDEEWSEANADAAWEEAQRRMRSAQQSFGPQGIRTVEQIQGKENRPPVDKYRPYLMDWAEDMASDDAILLTDADRMMMTPSAYLLEELRDRPGNAAAVVRSIDVDFQPYVDEMLNDPEIGDRLYYSTLDDVLRTRRSSIERYDAAPLKIDPRIVDRAREQFVEAAMQLPSSRYNNRLSGSYQLLKDYPGTETDSKQLAILLTTSPRYEVRQNATRELFGSPYHPKNPLTHLDIPEGISILANMIAREDDKYALKTLMDIVEKAKSTIWNGAMPREILQAMVQMLTTRSEAIANQNTPWAIPHNISEQDEEAKALNHIAIHAPDLLPQAIENLGQLTESMVPLISRTMGNMPQENATSLPEILRSVPPEYVDEIINNPLVTERFGPVDFQANAPDEVPLEDMSTMASRLDLRGQHDLADRLDGVFIKMAQNSDPLNERIRKLLEEYRPPGEATLPEEHWRGFHSVMPKNDGDRDRMDDIIRSIMERGLLMDRARGDTYGEPNLIWGTTGRLHNEHVPNLELALSREMMDRANIPWGQKTPEELDEYFSGENTFALQEDIPPDQIVRIHHPWHDHLRYILDNPHALEMVREDPGFYLSMEDYAPAVRVLIDAGLVDEP